MANVKNLLNRMMWDQNREPNLSSASEDICRPWNQEDFLARARTFTIPKWFCKSAMVSALECSRFGWICSGVNELSCVVCGVSVYFRSSPDLDKRAVFAVERAFHKRMISSHQQSCPWAVNSCSEDFSRLPMDPQLMTNVFNQQLSTWTSQNDQKDEKDQKMSDDLEEESSFVELSADSVREWVQKLSDTIPDASQVPLLTSVILACCGWSKKPISDASTALMVAECSMCHRRAGLWNYALSSSDLIPFPSSSNRKRSRENDPDLSSSSSRLMSSESTPKRSKHPKSSHYSSVFHSISTKPLNDRTIFGANLSHSALDLGSSFGLPFSNQTRERRDNSAMFGRPSSPPSSSCFGRREEVEDVKLDSSIGSSSLIHPSRRDAQVRREFSRKRKRLIDENSSSQRGIRQRTSLEQKNDEPEVDRRQRILRPEMSLNVRKRKKTDELEESHGKKSKSSESAVKPFHPILEHRHHCPWISPIFMDDDDRANNIVGWSHCLRSIVNLYIETPQTPIDAEATISTVRKLLFSVSSNSMRS